MKRNSLITIGLHELRVLWRDRTFQVLTAILVLLSGYTILSSVSSQGHAEEEHSQMTGTARKLFVDRKATNAHMAGHYGHVVFKPANFLQAIDPGVNLFTGTTVRLEAHRQNEAVFSQASGNSSLVRFGEFSFSLLLQVVFPLLIIFSCYRSVVGDRENGTLKLLMCQKISMRKLITGKILAYWCLYMLFLLLSAAVYSLLFQQYKGSVLTGSLLGRVFILMSLYGLYYLFLISVTVYFSARVQKASGLLVGLLAAWFICTIIMPKWAANAGEQLSPLPTRFAVNADIKLMKEGGIDGHNTNGNKTKAFMDSLLKAYRVDNISQLPVNFNGLLMQADEASNNKVYDKSLLKISGIIREQNRVGKLSGFINPFMSVRNLSMAIAGTDMEHHFDFTRSAENYRRGLIARLNQQDALRVSEFKDSTDRIKAVFWSQTADFRYTFPTLEWSLAQHQLALWSLGIWIFVVAGVIFFTSNKIQLT